MTGALWGSYFYQTFIDGMRHHNQKPFEILAKDIWNTFGKNIFPRTLFLLMPKNVYQDSVQFIESWNFFDAFSSFYSGHQNTYYITIIHSYGQGK